jgi:hypothetical protein
MYIYIYIYIYIEKERTLGLEGASRPRRTCDFGARAAAAHGFDGAALEEPSGSALAVGFHAFNEEVARKLHP